MDLYKIISQLTNEEFDEIYEQFTANKADKSALFLKVIRENPTSPDKEFLQRTEITASAFYVLKSRLNQRIEAFLLKRVGDPNLPVIKRVLSINELIYNNPREISVTALRRLEKELLKFDFPYGLMVVYKELQNMHIFDERYDYYKSRYNQQVAYALAIDKGSDLVVQFFKAYDNFFMTRKSTSYSEMVRIIEKIDNLNNLYESHRLYIFKSIIHIFSKLFIEIPDSIRCEIENLDVMFEKCDETLKTYHDDALYKNLNLLFNFMRYVYYEGQGQTKAERFFDILDYKIEELLTRYHFNANVSLFLSHKLRYHYKNNTCDELLHEVETYHKNVEVDPYRVSVYTNYHLFLAHTYFATGHFNRCSRILYTLRNEINLRKHVHMNLEVKFFLALTYVMMEDFDLATQLNLSLQRQLRKTSMAKYDHAKILLKILTIALGGKPRTRMKNLMNYIDRWEEKNVGPHALLTELNLRSLFVDKEPDPVLD